MAAQTRQLQVLFTVVELTQGHTSHRGRRRVHSFVGALSANVHHVVLASAIARIMWARSAYPNGARGIAECQDVRNQSAPVPRVRRMYSARASAGSFSSTWTVLTATWRTVGDTFIVQS